MNQHVKIIVIISVLIALTFILYFTPLTLKYVKYKSDMQKIAHIDIWLKHPIKNLESIEFKICDSIYSYSNSQLHDTICENVAISSKVFPCNVQISYFFKNNSIKILQVDSFNCAGCSGSNSYILLDDSVEYLYKN